MTKTGLSSEVDCRTFLKTTLGAGFAAAVMLVAAQTVIKPDSVGLPAGPLKIQQNGLSVPTYRLQPEGKTNLPVVLVISEIFGVHEHIVITQGFAKLDYMAIATEPFCPPWQSGGVCIDPAVVQKRYFKNAERSSDG